MKKRIVIVGGGVVGLFCAYYLQEEGHAVTLIDKGEMNAGASYVNAGYLTPSHIVPLAAPGMVTKGIKWMFNSSSPFYIEPRFDYDLWDWGIKFMRSCTHKHVASSLKIIKDINMMSKDLYTDLSNLPVFDFHMEDKGLLMAFRTSAAEREEAKVVKAAQKLGLDVVQIDSNEVNQIQPGIAMDIEGAFHYRCDAHSTPVVLMDQLKAHLIEKGVEIKKQTQVLDFTLKGEKVTQVNTTQGTFDADEVVVASGVWAQDLLKSVGIRLPLQAGKGYSLNEYTPNGISLPAILMESKVAVTPMQGFTRFSGTMEITSAYHGVRKNRVSAIARAVETYYPEFTLSAQALAQVQSGLRPLSPDGLPYIGRVTKYSNLSIATGHSMMGWSLGPVTGKLIAEMITDQKMSLNLTPFLPERRFGSRK